MSSLTLHGIYASLGSRYTMGSCLTLALTGAEQRESSGARVVRHDVDQSFVLPMNR